MKSAPRLQYPLVPLRTSVPRAIESDTRMIVQCTMQRKHPCGLLSRNTRYVALKTAVVELEFVLDGGVWHTRGCTLSEL